MDFFNFLPTQVEANTLIVFGTFLMLGVTGGVIANRFHWMPTVTAFMLLGMLLGPSGLGIIGKQMMAASSMIIDIALGLILYKLGNMLHPQAMLKSGTLLTFALFESLFTFTLVFFVMHLCDYSPVIGILVAAIAVSSSPAVLVHVCDELGARGPVTERAKELVAMNNLLSFILFSIALPFAIASEDKSLSYVIGVPAYRLLGASLVAIGVAWLATRIAVLLGGRNAHYRFAIVIGAIMLTLGFCQMLDVSKLLAPLILGIATCTLETKKHNLSRVGLGEGGDLFFIVLFVMAGAKINLADLYDAGLVALLLVIARIGGKFIGAHTAGYFRDTPRIESTAITMMLTPMAGMAIGLVATTASLAPEISYKISALVLAMVAAFETIGPFLTAWAIRLTGEESKDEAESQTDIEKQEN